MPPLLATRHGDDVVVTGMPGLDGWTGTVHADGSITITPADGERLTQPRYRQVPIGAVIDVADALTRDDRVAALVASAPPLTAADVAPGVQRNRVIARLYRDALAAGLPPRTVVAAVYGMGEQRAGDFITDARRAGALGTVHEERDRVAGRNDR